MKKITPIVTKYNNYKFRSRLEARWAVVFDALNILYEYEIEGFEMPSGTKYLPDFLFQELGVFVEIKPFEDIPYAEFIKIADFATHSEKPLLLIVGSPGKHKMWICHSHSNETLASYRNGDLGEVIENKDLPARFLKGNIQVRFASNPATENKTQLTFCDIGPHENYYVSSALLKGSEKDFTQ